MGRVYAVASGKGGVGKTVTTAALGTTLAAVDASVAVVDADLGMPNLGPALGVDDSGPTLHDALAGEASTASVTRIGPHGLSVVPGTGTVDAFATVGPAALPDAVEAVASDHDHVFVDVGAGLSAETLAPLEVADEVVLVATTARDALADASRMVDAAARLGRPVRGLVVTHADEGDARAAAASLGCGVVGTVPTDPAVGTALAEGVPLPDHAPRSPATAAYRSIARSLTDVTVVPRESAPSGVGGARTAATDGGRSVGGVLSRIRALV
jgi:septum site-determining protein MinD